MVHPVKQPLTTRDYLLSTTSRSMVADWISRGVPRWITLIDEFLYVVSSAIFIDGSRDFFPGTPFSQYVHGCKLFVIGSALNVLLAIFSTYEIFADAQLVGRRPKLADLVEQGLFVGGSLLFLVGTLLFTPPLTPFGETEAIDSSMRPVDVMWFGKKLQLVEVGGVTPEPAQSAIEMGDISFIAG